MVAYNATNKTANCTFKWNESTATYASNCSNAADTIANVTQIQAFDTVIIYNDSVKLYTLDNTTLANVGLTNAKLTDLFDIAPY